MGHNDRHYELTHPWLNFKLDLDRIPASQWLDLGEIRSKCEHITDALLRPDVAKDLHLLFLARGVHATTAIEGNTLSEEEVLKAVKGELRLPESQAYLQQEVNNIIEACNLIKDKVLDGREPDLTLQNVLDYHVMVLKGLPLNEVVVPGEIRQYSVVVAGYRGAPAEDCEFLLDRLCKWLGEFDRNDPSLRAPLAVVKAIIAHLYIAWIHPFGDGNGRTARLIEFRILLEAGLPSAAAHLLSNFYNRTRDEYYRQLDRSSRERNPTPFIEYATRGFVDELRSALDLIWKQQYQDRWEQFIYETFGEAPTATKSRQLRLCIDMSRRYWDTGQAITRNEISELTPKLAKAYADKTTKTVTRDLGALIDKGLIERVRGGYEPRIYRLKAFRAERRETEQ